MNAHTWGEWTDPALCKTIQQMFQLKLVRNQPENNISSWFCPILLAILVLCKLNTSRMNLTCDFLEDNASYSCICGNGDVFPRKNLMRQIGGLWGDTLKHIVDVSHWAIYRSQPWKRWEMAYWSMMEILISVLCSLKMTCVTYSTNANSPQRPIEIRSERNTDIHTTVDEGTA